MIAIVPVNGPMPACSGDPRGSRRWRSNGRPVFPLAVGDSPRAILGSPRRRPVRANRSRGEAGTQPEGAPAAPIFPERVVAAPHAYSKDLAGSASGADGGSRASAMLLKIFRGSRNLHGPICVRGSACWESQVGILLRPLWANRAESFTKGPVSVRTPAIRTISHDQSCNITASLAASGVTGAANFAPSFAAVPFEPFRKGEP